MPFFVRPAVIAVPIAAFLAEAPESRPLTQSQSKAILALWMPVHLAGNSFAARCLVRAWEGCFQAYAPPQIWQSPMWSFFQEALGREADGYGWSMRPLGASQTSWRQQNFESD